jgi:hypothetical protein
MEPGFIVVNEHRSGDVHRIDQTKTFGDVASSNDLLDLRRNVDESPPIRYFEPKMFG